MAEETILSDDFLRQLMNVGEVDILVAVPTYNNAATVGAVVQAVRAGLLKYFPRQRSVIINADGGSHDDTQELVRAASISDVRHVANVETLRTLHCISTRYEGQPGSGKALYTALTAADLLHPSACAVVSPDSISIQPEWIPRLLEPLSKQNLDLITPVYRRHKFDGLLVRNLIYPMSRALYAKRVREPYPSDFAFSGRLASHFINLDIWAEEAIRSGAELLLTISAITGGFNVAQAFVGEKARVDHSPADLVPAMRQTAGTLFWSMEKSPAAWTGNSESQPVETIGGEPEVSLEPLRLNPTRLYEMFCSGVHELDPVLKSILSPPVLGDLQRLSMLPEAEFCYPDALWVRTVYEFANSYHKAVLSRDHIIQALVPLYRGKTYTFVAENHEASQQEIESKVETLCLTFEQEKGHLVELWNGK